MLPSSPRMDQQRPEPSPARTAAVRFGAGLASLIVGVLLFVIWAWTVQRRDRTLHGRVLEQIVARVERDTGGYLRFGKPEKIRFNDFSVKSVSGRPTIHIAGPAVACEAGRVPFLSRRHGSGVELRKLGLGTGPINHPLPACHTFENDRIARHCPTFVMEDRGTGGLDVLMVFDSDAEHGRLEVLAQRMNGFPVVQTLEKPDLWHSYTATWHYNRVTRRYQIAMVVGTHEGRTSIIPRCLPIDLNGASGACTGEQPDEAALLSHKHRLEACFESVLSRIPNYEQAAELTVEIAGDGQVTDVSLVDHDRHDSILAQCLRSRLASIPFCQQGANRLVTYRIRMLRNGVGPPEYIHGTGSRSAD